MKALLGSLVLAVVLPVSAQQAPAFDVASIKRNLSGDTLADGDFQPGGRIRAVNVTLVNLIVARVRALSMVMPLGVTAAQQGSARSKLVANEEVQVSRVTLAPDASITARTDVPVVYVALNSGMRQLVTDGEQSVDVTAPGTVSIVPAGTSYSLRNVGTTPWQAIEVQARGVGSAAAGAGGTGPIPQYAGCDRDGRCATDLLGEVAGVHVFKVTLRSREPLVNMGPAATMYIPLTDAVLRVRLDRQTDVRRVEAGSVMYVARHTRYEVTPEESSLSLIVVAISDRGPQAVTAPASDAP